MRAVFGLVLVVGMGLAGFAVYMVKGHLAAQQQVIANTRAQAAAIVPTVEVYAVNREIAYGEKLTTEDIVKIRYAEKYLPEGAFTTEEELFPQGTEVVRLVTQRMIENEPVLLAKVTAPGEANGISALLTPGMRAFTIEVDQSTGVSGFLQPGHRVDIYWTGSVAGEDGRGRGSEFTRLIKRNVELIAVNQSADAIQEEATQIRTVTAQVSPSDIADLATLQSSGQLSLSLVGQGDVTGTEGTIVSDLDTILGIERTVEEVAEVAPEAPEICTIRQRSGTETKEIQIPCPPSQ